MHVKRNCNMVAHSAVKNSVSEKTHTPTLDSLVVHVEKIKYMGVIRLLLNGGIRLYRPQSEKKGKKEKRVLFSTLDIFYAIDKFPLGRVVDNIHHSYNHHLPPPSFPPSFFTL